MMISSAELLTKLREGIVVIVVKEPGGNTSEVYGTLDSSLLPVNETTSNTQRMLLQEYVVPSNSSKLTVWDSNAKTWRRIDVATIIDVR